MQLIKIITLLTVLLSVLTSCNKAMSYHAKEVEVLSRNWEFKMKGDTTWMPATVPGCVQTDLAANNKISDPFYRTNEKTIQWIDKKDWIYKCTFQVDSSQLQYRQITMCFNGLDTYAKVKLNGNHVLDADNMFRTWKAEVKPFLIAGKNELEIEFASPTTTGLRKLEENGYKLPAVNDLSEIGELGDKKISVFTRKAPYQYGWDWGPRIVTIGIWRPVELILSDYARIEDVFFKQIDITEKKAKLDAIIEINAQITGDYNIKIDAEPGNPLLSVANSSFYLKSGNNTVTLPILIQNPKIWWPNGMGEQNRYKFKVTLESNDQVIDTLSENIGLRSLKLIRKPDSAGKSFYFEVNGKPVFAKGANYIPNDNFLSRVTKEKYEYIIKSAAEANMNMIRVWGGGIYEDDILYDLCDKYGILIWQDFMFACSMYPGNEEFLNNVQAEIVDNVKRLRNHASIALWCGNNEIDAAWCQGSPDCGWGWKQQYTTKQQNEIWHNYDTLFHKIMPSVISALDNTHSYWPSSPTADWGVHSSYESGSGDVHYWGVWHGNEPFDAFYSRIGRFMSEYGFQSFPDIETIKKFTLPEDRNIDSEVMRWHQRSGYGNQRIIDYMKELYPIPTDFEKILYVSQVMQAEAIKQAINAHRANKPYCMGSLYWQLNDCWPVASWSGIDYYGHWKALHYFAKKAYQPVTISFVPNNDSLSISINNDTYQSKQLELQYKLIDFEGKELFNKSIPNEISPEKSNRTVILNLKDLKENYRPSDVVLVATVMEQGKEIYSDNFYLEIPKKLKLPKADLSYEIKQEGNTIYISIETKKLIKNLFVSIPGTEVQFSDNYFDLLPGESKTIHCSLPNESKISKELIKLISVNDILN